MNKYSYLTIVTYVIGYLVGIITINLFTTKENYLIVLGILVSVMGIYGSIIYYNHLLEKEISKEMQRKLDLFKMKKEMEILNNGRY